MTDLFTKEEIIAAYKKLKHYFYYDNTTLFIRDRIAQFETTGEIEKKFDVLLNSLNFNFHGPIDEKINAISYKITPKKIKKTEHGFITNKVQQENIQVERLSVFIDAEIELHIIAVLWLIESGEKLQKKISADNYAYKLELKEKDFVEDTGVVNGLRLYSPYFLQYQKWRDGAIRAAEKGLKNDKDIAIINLDIKDYFYNIKLDLQKVKTTLYDKDTKISDRERERVDILFDILNRIHSAYKKKLGQLIKLEEFAEGESPLPIGLISSGLLGNYYLSDFDKIVRDQLNPDYYGRYVDDILVVISNPQVNYNSISPQHTFLNRYFIEKNILSYESVDPELKLYLETTAKEENTIDYLNFIAPNPKDLLELIKYKTKEGLIIQGKKISFQHFDKKESRAAINNFKKGLEKNRSEFRYLPEEESVSAEFDEEAFSIHYTDSANKIRSISELSENKYGASKFLAKKIFTSLYSENSHDPETTRQILTFFKGDIAILFHTLWEKVATYFIVNDQPDSLGRFIEQVNYAISQLQKSLDKDLFSNDSVSTANDLTLVLDRIREDLRDYFEIALAVPLALDPEFCEKVPVLLKNNNVKLRAIAFRKSNLLRHAYVSIPILNYTTYALQNKYHSLLKVDLNAIPDVENELSILPESGLVKYSPRFVHFHECTIIEIYKAVLSYSYSRLGIVSRPKESDVFTDTIHSSFNLFWLINYEAKYPDNPAFKENLRQRFYRHDLENNYHKFEVENKKSADTNFRVAIANIKVEKENITASFLGNPNLKKERRTVLFDLINQAEKEKSDLFVLPEVSIPYAWLKLLPYQSYRSGMAIVAGLEHWVNKLRYAFNFLVTVLPIRVGNYSTCLIKIRLKNHYSHEEKRELEAHHCKVPNASLNKSYIVNTKEKIEAEAYRLGLSTKRRYDLFVWNKVYFSVYNCFELANIDDRGIFKAKVDFVIGSEYNKDIHYFSDIAGSWVRDIHCYFIQVNTSTYGDSRISRPSKSVTRDILQLKGGDNDTILTGKMHIKELREFQFVEYELQKDWSEQKQEKFKPTPPDFDKSEVEKRIKGK